MEYVIVSVANSRAMNGWLVPLGAAVNNFIGVSPGCETSRAEIVASVMRQMTGEPTHYSVSPGVYSLFPGE
jgi:hypothetical protein